MESRFERREQAMREEARLAMERSGPILRIAGQPNGRSGRAAGVVEGLRGLLRVFASAPACKHVDAIFFCGAEAAWREALDFSGNATTAATAREASARAAAADMQARFEEKLVKAEGVCPAL